jgi:hypothetical protein
VDKINQGIDPEAAGFEAGLDMSGTIGGTGVGRTDAYVGQSGGTPPTTLFNQPVTPSAPAAPTSNFERDPGFLDALTNPSKYNEDLIDSSGPYGTVNDPTATVSLTTTTDASPPPPPPPSRPPDFVTYTPPQDDSDDGNNNTGTQYSFSDLVPDEDDDFIDDTPIPSDESDSTETGGGGGGCCFIMLEARYGDGTMDDVVRRYRDEHMTVRNKRGYYKVAEVLVPLMRKSRLAKWLVIKTFADPLVSYGKYYYGQNKHGVIFAPVKSFWMSVFNIVGGETEFIRENGKVV